MTGTPAGRVAGKTAVVTGAARGLGAAVARRLGAEGANVALTDLDPAGLEHTASELAAAGTACVALAGDITDPATLAGLTDLAQRGLGVIDVLVNVAGISPPIPLEKTTASDFERIMGVNCLAHLLGIQAVLPSMTAGGGGSIVNISSVGALVALPQLAAYSASKAAASRWSSAPERQDLRPSELEPWPGHLAQFISAGHAGPGGTHQARSGKIFIRTDLERVRGGL